MWFLLLILIFLFLFFAVIYYYILFHYNFRSLSKIPSIPDSHFFFGNLSYFGNNIVDTLAAVINIPIKFGPIVRVDVGPFRRAVVLTDAKDVEFFLSSNEHITKSPGYDGFKPWLGNGLINSAGDYWRKHRKIITPTFHFQILDKFTNYINGNSEILIEKLAENVDKYFDIYPIINLYSLDVICETAMNIKINAMNDGNTNYVNAVKDFLEVNILRFFSFVLQNEVLFKFTKEYRKQQNSITILKQFTAEVIKKRREERKLTTKKQRTINDDNIKERIAFLDLLLDMQDDQGLSDDEIREEVDTFMFAGHDTVSSAISFSLFNLAQYPEVQERIYEESVDILNDEELTFRSVQNLKYLDMVVKECMRIYTIVPFIERQLLSNVTHNGVMYPAKTIIMFVPFAMHKNPEVFPEPLKFDPERFLPENIAKRHPYSYIPFSAGPRNCIGQRFAVLETKATIVKIIRKFKINAVKPAHVLRIGNDGVLKCLNGIPVVLSVRK